MGKLLDSKSFVIRTIILFIGFVFLWWGSQFEDPKLGFLVSSVGLAMDWAMVYLVYRDITRMKNDIERNLERTKHAGGLGLPWPGEIIDSDKEQE